MKNKNISFTLKFIFALIPLIAILLYTLLFPMGYMDSEYPAWKYSKDVSEGRLNPFETDGPTASIGNVPNNSTVIIGDSRAMADLNPLLFSNDVVNLAVGGGTSIEMFYTLKRYVKNHGAPKNIIVMFAPFHQSIIDNFFERDLFFNYLTIPELYDLYGFAHIAHSETLLQENYVEEIISCRLRAPEKYLPPLINAKGYMRYDVNQGSFDIIKAQKGHALFGTLDGCSDLNYETSYYEMHKTGDALLLNMYLTKILDLCKSNNINVILSQPPMNKSSFDNLQDTYVNEFTEYIESIAYKYPDFTINPEITYMDDIYFGDSSHLNTKGSTEFTNTFCQKYGF